jgi:hypothetical protein
MKNNKIPFATGMIEGDEEKIRFRWGVKALPWLILTNAEHIVRAEGFEIAELDERIKAISHERAPKVPHVVGMPEPRAKAAITAVDDSTVGAVTYEHSDTVPTGHVISQSPPGGKVVPTGSSIRLVVSIGQP